MGKCRKLGVGGVRCGQGRRREGEGGGCPRRGFQRNTSARMLRRRRHLRRPPPRPLCNTQYSVTNKITNNKVVPINRSL